MVDLNDKLLGWRGAAALACIAASAAASLLVLVLRGDPTVSAQDLAALGQALRDQPGTLLVHPPWRDDVAERLRQELPRRDVRLAAPVFQGRPVGDLTLVRVGGSPGPAALWGEDAREVARFGPLRAQRVALGQASPGAEEVGNSLLLSTVDRLRVTVDDGDRQILCDRFEASGPRLRCPGMQDWNYVGRHSMSLGGQERTCLWAHPVTGARLVIEAAWPADVSALAVSHGLSDSAAGAPDGQPVTLEVLADDVSLARYVQPNQRGYTREALAVPPELTAQAMRLVITTPHDGARHFCLDVEVTSRRAPAAGAQEEAP